MGGPELHCKLHELFVSYWEQDKFPSDLCDAVIFTLYKNKGEKSGCSNYQGITLLSIAGKILARVLLNRLVPTIAEYYRPETQYGLRANRSITDMVFALRDLQEKCWEKNKGVYVASVNLTNAFDRVSRKGLWSALAVPRSSSVWLSNCTKTSAAKLGWTATSLYTNRQRCETGLYSGSSSVQHLSQHDA